ncbi:MAG TPA: M61 family peptidase [Thiotrichales bacterium]|nr:M61 family peptidase [Thiotrichales bacterium]
MSPAIRYRIRPQQPAGHYFEVQIEIDRPDPAGQRLAMPAWIPGSYMIRDFARNVGDFEASCGERRLGWRKLDKQTWALEPCEGTVRVRYRVYAWDLSVRTAHLDTTHGYFNGTAVFMAVEGREGEPCRVEILPPEGAAYEAWRVATTLSSAGAPPWGFGAYGADDYDELVDHPVEMGTFTLAEFRVAGVPHFVAVTGRHEADMDRLCADLERICSTHVALFGEFPAERYLFQIMAVGEGYGGLEHRSSTSLLCCREDLPRAGLGEPDEGYQRLLGLCSHEYFHTWNVKRIRPAAFIPYDLSREVHTRTLWAFEGITSYYDDLGLVRSGVIPPRAYLRLLSQVITRVWRAPGRFHQSVAESSFDAWTRFYKQDENAPNAIVSYYTKGALVALCLDLTLRRETDGERSLDDLMRRLWRDYGRTGRGVGEREIEAIASEICGSDLSGRLEEWLDGTGDLPVAELLASVGVEMRLRPQVDARDWGGREAAAEELPAASLGAEVVRHELGGRLRFVFEGGAARKAGLSAGDVVVAMEGLRVDHESLQARVARMKPGRRVLLHAFRRDELMTFEVELQAPPADTCDLRRVEGGPEETARGRQAWLGRVE